MTHDEAPVVPGHIYGLRQWAADRLNGTPRLGALVQSELWPAHGEPLHATCLVHSHHAPDARCSCGVYAWHPTDENASLVFPPRLWDGAVTGIVEAWGEVEVHAAGFRAQYARPHRIVIPSRADGETRRLVEALAAEYHAEVLTVKSPEQLSDHCREHGLGMSPGALRDLLGPAADEVAKGRSGRLGRRLRRTRTAAAVVLTGLVQVVVGAAFVAMYATTALGILSLFGISPLGGHGDPAPTRADRALRTVEQALLRYREGSLYVALVRNTSRTRTAMNVVPTGRFVGASGGSVGSPHGDTGLAAIPSIPPGSTAAVVDWHPGAELAAAAGFAIRFYAESGWAREAPAPASITGVRADLRRCVVAGTVRSRRALKTVDAVLVARDRRRRVTWVSRDGAAGPLPRGSSRRILFRIPPAGCRRSVRSVEAYPWWGPGELSSAWGD